MSHIEDLDRRRRLMDTLAGLSQVATLAELIDALRESARRIAAADGIALIRRSAGDRVTYIAEDSQSPLWAGDSFPIESCISGIAMLENRPILIPDIYADTRVPHDAYRTTFVRSMAMFPIGCGEPEMALGAYWSTAGEIDSTAVSLMSSLARAASDVFARVDRRATSRFAVE